MSLTPCQEYDSVIQQNGAKVADVIEKLRTTSGCFRAAA